MPRSWGMVGGLVVLAALAVVGAALYWTGTIQVFANGIDGTPHHKHAALLAGIAVLLLIAASFARPRRLTA